MAETAHARVLRFSDSAEDLVGKLLQHREAVKQGLITVPTVAEQSTYQAAEQGEADTTSYRLVCTYEGETTVSYWHGIPLHAGDGAMNMVVEIPKNTTAKMEVATAERGNPIKQDIKKGKLRHYPYAIHWNYGMLPQTWENPDHANDELDGVRGDNDPVDVVELGSTPLKMGGVYKVKVLGVYAMIDDGELDWKVLAINVEDPLAPLLNDIDDLERELPGEMQRVMEWFRDYKIPDGKPANKFGFDYKPLNREFALNVIKETHHFYDELKSGVYHPKHNGLSMI
jgi:inorganic pyrophosphatase